MIYHICNPNTDTPLDSEAWLTNIDSEAALEKLRLDEADSAVYLLNVHLNWNGQAFSHDYGFDVANILRTRNASLAPIIFYSPIPVKYFEYKSKGGSDFLKYQILYGRGSSFIEEFPIDEPFNKELKDNLSNGTPPLTPSSLVDVQITLCDLKGLVLDKLAHNLKPAQDPSPHFVEIEGFLNVGLKENINFERYRKELHEKYTSRDEVEFIKTKEEFIALFGRRLTTKVSEVVAAPAPEDKKYKVLIVEDEEEDLQKAVTFLREYFHPIPEKEAKKAIERLKKDSANEILAVICDWRLYKNESKYWQKSHQGYEVLEEASKTGRGLFALTSEPDFVVHQIRNKLGCRFQLIKKEDFHSDSQKALLVAWIQNACQNNLLDEGNIPTGKLWKEEYRDTYLELRSSLDWDVFKLCVISKANEVWAYSLKQGKNANKLSRQFGLSFPAGNTRLKLFSALVLRLVWFSLWHKYGFEAHKVYTDLGEFVEYEKSGFETVCDYFVGVEENPGQRSQDIRKAGLEEYDISAGRMFPYERAWLFSRNLLKEAEPLESKPSENDVNEREKIDELAEIFTEDLRAEWLELRSKATKIIVNREPGEFTKEERLRMNYLGLLEHNATRSRQI
jgi:hypothetical protein